MLGPVEVMADGAAVPLGGRAQRTLLALLLLEPGRPVSSDRLADALWEGRPPRGAGTTLRSYVSRLRRALGSGAVATRAGGYALEVEPGDLDVARFERLLSEGREASRRGAAGLAAERLHAALDLWRGPALADVRDVGLLAREAARLDELRLACLEERIDADLALGRESVVVPELLELVREHPLRERLRYLLVLALYRSGRQAEALAAYREARELLDVELGLEPSEELKRLEIAILRQEVEPARAPESRHNLPQPTTSFVGRERELDELAEMLRQHRLVTITGMGGSGKTRLALETARRQVPTWADGVWLADLTALADPGLVVAAVATPLGAEPDLESLLAQARGLECLLVLDNCEHLVDACAGLVDSLLRACPNVRILATSRVPLGVAAEHDFTLEELDGPQAVQLFVERATAIRRDLEQGEEAREAIAEICAELDGLPLAVELAAARVKGLSLGEIAARLDDRFRFLRAWRRVADHRHRTLETTMDWSYDLLAPAEQDLLRKLAVFAGGATLGAVADVCLGGDSAGAADLLGRLVDASLVRAEVGEATRYRLLETVRQYAAAKLALDPAADSVRRRHAEHYLAVAESANLSIDALGRGPQRQEIAVREQHNLRAAVDWAAEADAELGLRLMVALENFWVTHAALEAKRRYGELLARSDGLDPAVLVPALRDYAACHDVLGEWERAGELYERSGELARAAGDELGVLNAKFRLGVVAYHLDPPRTRDLWLECRDGYARLGYRIGEIQALGNLGGLEIDGGDAELGREMTEAAMEMAREAGWWWWVGRGHASLAETEIEAGRPDEAERHARELLTIAAQTANPQDTLFALAVLARAAAQRGDEERALALWASVAAVEDAPGRFGRFDRAEYAAAMPEGPPPAPLPLDQAVVLGLSS